MNGFEDFDRYCDENNIQPGEEPAAFAAWLNETTGWDGQMGEVPKCPVCEGEAGPYRLSACSLACDMVLGDPEPIMPLVIAVLVIVAIVVALVVR